MQAFAKILKNYGLNANIINTPKAISTSCGLSIKTEYRNIDFISQLISSKRVNNIIGVFLLNKTNFGDQVNRLY